jgi:hypothetical protein
LKRQLPKLIVIILAVFFITSCGSNDTTTVWHISFDDIAPEGYMLTQSWDALGIDSNDNVYIGFTALRPDGREDVVLFMYNHDSGERRLLGTFMQAAEEAGNLMEDEEIPKGHTNLVYVDGRLFMASQGFHDFKESLDGLENYRGAHLFYYDTRTGNFVNVSASLPGGVVLPNEGIIALSHMPSAGYLVGLSHPHSNIVLYCIEANEARVIPGIPWSPGLVVSRTLVVDDINQRIYLYRGPENTTWRYRTIYTRFTALNSFPVYVYDLATDTLRRTDTLVAGGMWGTAQMTADGQTAYVSTAGGYVVKIDFNTGMSRIIADLLPNEFHRTHRLSFLYHITLSECETRIYTIPTYASDISGLYMHDLLTRYSVKLMSLPCRVYTGAGIRDSAGRMYFAAFGYHDWTGNCYLLIIQR